jgi:ribonuclease P protein component
MINRAHRFHGYNALRYVYKQGKTVRVAQGALFTLRYVLNPQRKTYRLAVVVSKKQSKSAVVRNRIRRRLYEAGRELIPESSCYDLVFTVTSDQTAIIPKKDINETLSLLLQTSGIGKR